MKQNKIIAVDTNLGTNFLISASDVATVSELRGLIQLEHFSCFPEHGSVDVMALTVQHGQRFYHVTNSLLLGQIFRKRWNVIHAVVSSKDASKLHGSKSSEVESLANGKAQKDCVALNDRSMAKCAGIEGMGVNIQGSDAIGHTSRPHLCGEKLPENCNEVVPVASNSGNSLINLEMFKCPLLSMEAPCTQSFSPLNLALSDEDKKIRRKCRKRKGLEGGEIPGRKRNQVEIAGQVVINSDMDKELSPGNRCASSTARQTDTEETKGFLLACHDCEQDRLCRHGSSKEMVLKKRDVQIAEPEKKSTEKNLQPTIILSSKTSMKDDRIELSNDLPSSKAFVEPDEKSWKRNAQPENLLSGKTDVKDECVPNEHNKDSPNLDVFVEHDKKSRNEKSQSESFLGSKACTGDDSVPKEDTQTFVGSPRKLKLTSEVGESLHNGIESMRSCQANFDVLKPSLSEKELATLEKKLVSQTSAKTRTKRDVSHQEFSSETREEGAEEAIIDIGASINKMDLSMGYPIQLNDHSILLVASLSADVVPETQESQWQSQDGEEVALAKRGLDVYDQAVLEPHSNCPRQVLEGSQEVEAQGLLLCEGRSNMNSTELNNGVHNLAVLAEKKETLNSKASVVVDLPYKSFGAQRDDPERSPAGIETEILGACHDNHERQLQEAGLSGANHDGILVQKKKKRRKKKVSELDKVSVKEDRRFVISGSHSLHIKGDMDSKTDIEETALLIENRSEACNHEKGRESCDALEKQAQTELEDFDADPREVQVEIRTVVNVDEGNCSQSPCRGKKTLACSNGLTDCSLRNERQEKCISGSLKEGCKTLQREYMKQGEPARSEVRRKKRKKHRKKPTAPSLPGPEGALGDHSLNMDKEGNSAPFSIKDLPNTMRLKATMEGESVQKNKAEVVGERVIKKKLRRKTKEMAETDPNIGLMQEQDQEKATLIHADRNGTESTSKHRLVASSSTRSSLKECSQEALVNTKQGFDVFEFESSGTGNRQKSSGIDNEVTSHAELNNLEKLCSAAVRLVEDDILNSSNVTTRKSSRKAVHPKRWITVLSERLQWSQLSKKNSKEKHGNKQSKSTAKEEEAKKESSQIIVEDGRVPCAAGCGRLYSKKTSAYYRHSKKCSGGDD